MATPYQFLPENQKIELINILKNFIKKQSMPTARVVHAKDIACVSGLFRVLDVPPEYQIGLFKQLSELPCWIRISKTLRKSDSKYHIFGIAIKLYDLEKLIGAPRDDQDFLAVTSPIFPVANAIDFFYLMKAVSDQTPNDTRFKKMMRLSRYFFSSYSRFKALLSVSKSLMKSRLTSLFSSQYYSGLAFRFGENKVMKYKIVLSSKNHSFAIDEKNHSYRDEFKNRLQQGSIYLDFLIQLQTDPKQCPIDDGTVKWDEAIAPFVKVAEIEIPPQDFLTVDRTHFSEDLQFNPINSLKEHEPLGSLNELRCYVYKELSEYRKNNKLQTTIDKDSNISA